jgi:hypothetical protein
MSPVTHSSGVMNNHNTFEAFARPENASNLSELASVHFNLENAEKVCNLVEPVNG